jgi:1,4-dihydroxy-2-naphthoyl-CoA hydrolase
MPDGWEPVVPFDRCFDAQYGLEVLSHELDEKGSVRARVRVRDELLNHLGVVHGGVFASAAEALASRGTALEVMPRGRVALGLSNDTTVIASPSAGIITLDAEVRGRGDQEWVWNVDARDDQGRLCANSRVTVAVRDAG